MTTLINADTVVGGAVVTADASGQLGLQAAGVTKLTVASTGVNITGIAYPTADGTSGQVLQTNGSGTLSFATPAAGTEIGLVRAVSINCILC
jgi:hypothetical protein